MTSTVEIVDSLVFNRKNLMDPRELFEIVFAKNEKLSCAFMIV